MTPNPSLRSPLSTCTAVRQLRLHVIVVKRVMPSLVRIIQVGDVLVALANCASHLNCMVDSLNAFATVFAKVPISAKSRGRAPL